MIRGAAGAVLLVSLCLRAQGPPPGPGGGMGRRPFSRGPSDGERGPVDWSGKWWNNRDTVARLGLTAAQQKRIEQVFQQRRLSLIDLRAALEKQESMLEPLLADEHPQEGLVLPQIDRIATARAELEKANARMLFEMRLVLTTDQWKELQASDSRSGPMGPPRRR